MPNHLHYQLLTELLDALRAEGYPMGTGKHLQLQELLRKIPDGTPPERLKTLLAPIFAANKQEQAYFYEVFDKSWARVQAAQLRTKAAPPPIDKAGRWRNVLAAVLAILALFLAFALKQYFYPLEAVQLEPQVYQLTAHPGDTVRQQLRVVDPDSLFSFTFCDEQTIGVDSAFGHYAIDSTGLFAYVARDTMGPHTLNLCVKAEYAPQTRDTNYITITFPEITEEPVLPEAPTAELELQPLPYPRSLDRLQVNPEEEKRAQLYNDYGHWAKLALMLLLGALLYAFLQWREQRRRKLVAELESRTAPPYVFNIDTDYEEPLAWGERLQRLLTVLRRRALSEAVRLDLPATIHSTVKQAGRLSFQFRQQTRPPEYLFLVERYSQYDHRARLYDALYQQLRENEVYALRFFYDGDLRLCFNERTSHGAGLKELAQKYGASRLIIIGNGYGLLSPLSGKLSKWTNVFNSWRRRAILTPVPSSTWGRREERLAEHFQLAPASLQGLEVLADQFDAKEAKTYDELLPKVEDAPKKPILIEGDFIQSLQRYYPPRLLDWIAACAIYPSLEWDLTLHLGEELSGEEEKLLTAVNLFQLIRLPWFIEGKIPQGAREALMDYLAERGLEERIRRSIHGLLEKQQPNPAAAAFDDYRMNVVLNELLFTKDPGRKKKLEEEFARYLAAGHQPDFVTFKYLEREQSRFDLPVPDSWKKYLYKAGLPQVGWQNWLWALPVWLLLTGLLWWWQPAFERCDGEEVEYKERRLCLRNDADRLLLAEFKVRDKIPEAPLPEVDSLAQSKMDVLNLAGRPEADTFYQNIAVAFYNHGAGLYNQASFESDSAQYDLRYSACSYLSYAIHYDSLANDSAVLSLPHHVLKGCEFLRQVLGQDTSDIKNALQALEATKAAGENLQQTSSRQQAQLDVEIFSDKTGLKGLRQKDGSIVADAAYRELEKDPETGLYRFLRARDGRLGYLNSRGQVLFAGEFGFLGFSGEGLIAAQLNGLYKYVNTQGKVVIPRQFTEAERFRNGRAQVKKEVDGVAYTYIIDKDGACVQDCPPSPGSWPSLPPPVIIFFDHLEPGFVTKKSGGGSCLEDAYSGYQRARNNYLNNNAPSEASRVNSFFEREINSGLQQVKSWSEGLIQAMSNIEEGNQLIVELRGYSSSWGDPNANQLVTKRRIECVRDFIENYSYRGRQLKDYVGNKLIIKELSLGSSEASSKYPDDDPLSRWGISAALDRRVEIVYQNAPNLYKGQNIQTDRSGDPEDVFQKPPSIPDYAPFTDPRDNQPYRALSLNGLTWIVGNLNYAGEKQALGVYYDNNEKNGAQYGRLYTWEEARQACPRGWRLPTDEEWRSLIAFCEQSGMAGGSAYEALLEGGETGFAARLGGYRYADGSFEYLGLRGYYWSATEYSPVNAWGYTFDLTKKEVERVYGDKSWGFSCRCVKE